MILDTIRYIETDIKILKSNDYEAIKFKKDNRDLDNQMNERKARESRAEINKIKASMKKVDFIPQPIIVNSKGEIEEGQHRFIAAKELGIPFLFTVYDGLTMRDIMLMNSCGRKWDVLDCIKSYSAENNSILSYKYLDNLFKLFYRRESGKNYFGIRTIFCIVFNANYSNQPSVQNNINDGLLKVTSQMYEHAYRKACWINDCISYYQTLNLHFKGNPDYLIKALSYCYDIPDINNDKLSETIKYNFSNSQIWRNLTTALNALEVAYNSYTGRKVKSNKTFVQLYRQKFARNMFLFYDNIEQQPRDIYWKGYDEI